MHKILKLQINEGDEKEIVTMLIDSCAMQKSRQHSFLRLRSCYASIANFVRSWSVMGVQEIDGLWIASGKEGYEVDK